MTATLRLVTRVLGLPQVSLPRSAHLGEAVANLPGVQRWLLPGGEVAPPVQDVVMDQVWHPPIAPAPRGAVGLARVYADAYGKLQSGRCDVRHGQVRLPPRHYRRATVTMAKQISSSKM